MFQARFRNREEAAKKLVSELLEYRWKNPMILAIPRGGVVVAYEIAKALNAPLDLIIPRKMGAPGNPELAIGAVTEDGTTILNQRLVEDLGIAKDFIELEKANQIQEIKRRTKAYRSDSPLPDLKNKTIILVDDGIATGATMKAAIRSVRKQNPLFIIVAIPVAPPDTVKELSKEVDKLVCPVVFEPFFAIGQFYEDFSQVSDEEVIRLLKLAKPR
ncbi:MAG: putative phosphoribosyl transferase [Thermoproteota archaeon]|nr:putative phosphoribosyl transferase [Thermoproteota archaeon]